MQTFCYCDTILREVSVKRRSKVTYAFFVKTHDSRAFSMPYILVRGNLASYGNRYPWRVLVSGLKATDIEQLKRFASGGYCDDSTIVYLQHPCVILTALEVLGYKVVASSSTSIKQDYNEYMWTMRKEFAEPDPATPNDGQIKVVDL